MLKDKFSAIFTGMAGAGATEVVEKLPVFDPQPVTEGVGLISQIVILVATLIALFKKKKPIE